MNDWNIQSRGHACEACERRFADKEKYHTLLVDHKGELQRVDVCRDCWAAQYEEGAKERKGFVSYWQGVYEAPPPAPPEAIQRDTAETLLRKLVEKNDPEFAAASYILAVMLERKRQLRVKETVQRDGVRVFVYEQPKTGDLFSIPDPDLQLDQLDAVQKQVADLLEQGARSVNAPAIDKNAPDAPDASEANADTGEVGVEGAPPSAEEADESTGPDAEPRSSTTVDA